MLWTIAGVLLVIWLLGFLVFNVGSLIHLLLIFALVAVTFRLVQGKKPF